MRSSKSRSRGKSNRNRSNNNNSNNVNRVFDSSGPEGRVRGTPQQVFEKYSQLARDAELGNDRVAQENFQQHAEHYLRMLTVAQREADARREQHERENRERQVERDRERAERSERDRERNERDRERRERESANRQAADARREESQKRYEANRIPDNGPVVDGRDAQADQVAPANAPTQNPAHSSGEADLAEAPQPDVVDHSRSNVSGLVDTPENAEAAPAPKPKPKRAPRKPRAKPKPKSVAEPVAAEPVAQDAPAASSTNEPENAAE